MVLTYHRIGDAANTPYDPWTFTATTEQFDEHIRYLKRRFYLTDLNEAIDIASGKTKRRRTSVLITFDDGYRDSYTEVFPILQRHEVSGVFFLPTRFIGTGVLPWWDVIAYLIKRSRRERIALRYPESVSFDLVHLDRQDVIRQTLLLFKSAAMQDRERFLSDLEETTDAQRPDCSKERCFLSWQEAREMIDGGMTMGSHTDTHEILARLEEENQYQELASSRACIEEKLGIKVDVLAYPDGTVNSFNDATLRALKRADYRAAFSFYGGLNKPGRTNVFDIRRYGVDGSMERMRLQTTLAGVANRWI